MSLVFLQDLGFTWVVAKCDAKIETTSFNWTSYNGAGIREAGAGDTGAGSAGWLAKFQKQTFNWFNVKIRTPKLCTVDLPGLGSPCESGCCQAQWLQWRTCRPSFGQANATPCFWQRFVWCIHLGCAFSSPKTLEETQARKVWSWLTWSSSASCDIGSMAWQSKTQCVGHWGLMTRTSEKQSRADTM